MLSLFVAMQTLKTSLSDRLHRDETGATAVEYGVMVALIAGAIVVTVGLLGTQLDLLFEAIRGIIEANTP